MFSQCEQRPIDALARGGLGRAERLSDLIERQLPVEPEQNDQAVGFREPGDGGVDFLGTLAGSRLGRHCHRVCRGRFMLASRLLGSPKILDREVQCIEKPTRKLLAGVHGVGLLCQDDEHDLDGVFGEVTVLQLPQSRGENPRSVPVDDLRERGLVCLPGKRFKQLPIIVRAALVHDTSFLRFHVRSMRIWTHYLIWLNKITCEMALWRPWSRIRLPQVQHLLHPARSASQRSLFPPGEGVHALGTDLCEDRVDLLLFATPLGESAVGGFGPAAGSPACR